jgi:hypothetical protein
MEGRRKPALRRFREGSGLLPAGYSRDVRFAVVLALFLVVLPAAGASARSAHITMVSRSPVVVRGTGFRPSERVTVSVSAKATYKKVVIASRLGAFRVTFRSMAIGSCQFYSAQANGSRGSIASLKVIPECAAP